MVEKTKQQVLRFLAKVAERFPKSDEPEFFTDIHIRVSQDSGDVMAYDDDDKEITRVVVDEWIESPHDTEYFYSLVSKTLQECIGKVADDFGIIRPYNFVLENENGEHIAELYVVDDSETMIIGKPYLQDLENDLDDFITNLLKDK